MEPLRNVQNLQCPNCGSSDVRWWRIYKRRHRYICNKCDHHFFADGSHLDVVDGPDSEYAKDVWDIRNLTVIGLESSVTHGHYKLNFTLLRQDWLREAVKKFTKYGLATVAYRTANGRLRDLKYFSDFLQKNYSNIQPSEINRQVVVDFLSYLVEINLGGRSRQQAIYNLRIFFEHCVRNDWLDLPKIPLVFQEDLPPREKHNPRFIPDAVIEQLNIHIEELPEPLMRMFLVIQEVGMRISELCLLKRDCITQDAEGDWWLTYHQFKMRKDHTVTISKEVAGVILEQQQYIQSVLSSDFPYLFCASGRNEDAKELRRISLEGVTCTHCGSSDYGMCGRNRYGYRQFKCRKCGKIFHRKDIPYEKVSPSAIEGRFIPVHRPPRAALLAHVLNKLAEKYNICTISGECWHFQAHQFRHSVGTNMINRGVPIHIVSRFLGHETLQMTQVYAHIHDKTLKEEFRKYQDKMVDVTGKVVEFESVAAEIAQGADVNSIDSQWLKRNVMAQALPNGTCAIPAVQKTCPHGANKCITGPDGKGCPHFKTDIRFFDKLNEHLERTNEIVEWAQQNPDSRRAAEILQINLPVKQNLERIVRGLESLGGQDASA